MNIKTDKLLARPKLDKRTSLMGGIAAISMAVIVGTVAVVSSFAANEQLFLSPATGDVLMGNTIAVQIRVNSGTDTVNAVQANLSYDPTKLQFQSVDASGSAFDLSASSVTTSGVVQLARATGGGVAPVSGDKLFATVTFKAMVGTGTADVKVETTSHVVRSTDATDILTASAGATYNLTLTPGASPSPSVAPSTSVSPSTSPGVSPTPSASPGVSPTPSTSPSVSPTPGATPVSFTGQLHIMPAAITAASGANVTVDIMEDSGTTEVNAIQANIKFDPAQLQYLGADSTGSDFPLNAVTATGSGTVKLTRALNGGDPAVSGNKLVAKVAFKVLANAGSVAPISFDAGSVISTLDGMNALVASTNSAVTVTAAGTGTTATPTPPVTATPVTGTPAPTVNPGTVTQTPVRTSPVVTIPIVGARRSIRVLGTTKLTAPSIPSNATIAYAIDNKATAPVIDTTTLDNGTHTVTAITTDSATGATTEVKQKITIDNTQPLWKTLVQGMTSSWPYLVLILAVVGLAVGLWLFLRRMSQVPGAPMLSEGVRTNIPDTQVTKVNTIDPTKPGSGPTGPLGF